MPGGRSEKILKVLDLLFRNPRCQDFSEELTCVIGVKAFFNSLSLQ